MSYIDNNLMEGEKVVYRTKLHWIIFGKSLIFLIFFFFSMILFFYGYYQNLKKIMYIGGGLAIILGLFALAYGFNALIEYSSSEFGLTNKRVMIKTGFIKRESLEIVLAKVEAMHVSQGIMGRMLNYGRVDIRGTGGTSNSFDRIKDPLEFRKRVLEQVSEIQMAS